MKCKAKIIIYNTIMPFFPVSLSLSIYPSIYYILIYSGQKRKERKERKEEKERKERKERTERQER